MLRSGTGRLIEGTSVSRPTKAPDNVVWVVVTRRGMWRAWALLRNLGISGKAHFYLRLPRVVELAEPAQFDEERSPMQC